MTRQPTTMTLFGFLCLFGAFCVPYEAHAAAKDRYAALECQNNGAFVLVNFYPDGIFQLTWGKDDRTIQEDVIVTRSYSVGREIYKGENLTLSLPAGGIENSMTPRIADFAVESSSPIYWQDLRCFLYGAD